MPRPKTREQLDHESAERSNAQSAQRWALWAAAGKLDEVASVLSGADVAFARDDHQSKRAAHTERTRRKNVVSRLVASRFLDPSEVAIVDDKIANLYPSGPEYAADAWCQAIVKASGQSVREVCAMIDAIFEQSSDLVRPSSAGLDLVAQLRASLSLLHRP